MTYSMVRAVGNPLISPLSHHNWENLGTFNPAVVQVGGKIHILYRAQGIDRLSTLGYALSDDGMTILERLPNPIFSMNMHVNALSQVKPLSSRDKIFVAEQYQSGGSEFGVEDPRITVVGDTIHMFFVFFDGVHRPRLAWTHLSVDHFLNHHWDWSEPQFISSPLIVEKSGALFPEKISGRYLILHRYFPNIQLDYRYELDFSHGQWLKADAEIPVRQGFWDSRKIGAGPPPIKTPLGWLLIYYGVDDLDDSKYHMGAMLLDLERPEKVLGRTPKPILSPERWYENEGFKHGIIYPCGAAVVNQTLITYYGGSDSFVAAAQTNLSDLLGYLQSPECQTREQEYAHV